MGVYVGMDVHRKRSQVALLDEHGAQLLNRNLPNDPAELVPLLGQLEPGTPVAFEAAYGWGWLVDLLGELDLEPHLVHPSRCKAIASARLKDDKVDARTLAHLLRADLLPEAWLAPQQVRDQRALLRHRAALVRVATMLKNRVHAVLADRGIRVPERLWTTAGRAWLADLDLPAVQRRIVDDCLGLVDQLTPVVARLERDLRDHARPDPRVQALAALPGIGMITAMTLAAEIGDIGRFPTARKLCAWAGLTPAVRNSDRKVRHGHITKQGSPWVRWVLEEAAHKAKTRPPFAGFYAECAARRGRQIATVAVARKLLARAFHVLKEVDAARQPSEKVTQPGALALHAAPATRPKF
jgi:transposase